MLSIIHAKGYLMRHYSLWDRLVLQLDEVLQSVPLNSSSNRPNPSENLLDNPALNKKECQHSAGLMRINHVGEICAQALYAGQALTARSQDIKQKLQKAAQEEVDHMSWCQQRIEELETHTSYLNPFWYISALLIGFSVGLFGDKVSLGFLAETEHQVARHLEDHLQRLPRVDKKSRVIVEQMRLEEMEHALTAEQAGAIPLPLVIRWSMQSLAKFMSLVAYRI